MPTATRLATCDDVTGLYLPGQSCRWGVTTSTGSYTPAWCFDPIIIYIHLYMVMYFINVCYAVRNSMFSFYRCGSG